MHSDLKIPAKWHVNTWEEPGGGAEDVKKTQLINFALELFLPNKSRITRNNTKNTVNKHKVCLKKKLNDSGNWRRFR